MIAVLTFGSNPATPNRQIFPPEITSLWSAEQVLRREEAKSHMLNYQLQVFQKYGGLMLRTHGLHPEYPFWHPIPIEIDEEHPDELKWMIWYLVHLHYIAIELETRQTYNWLKNWTDTNGQPSDYNIVQILLWFAPISHWLSWLKIELETKEQHMPKMHSIFICRKYWYTDRINVKIHSATDIEPYGVFHDHCREESVRQLCLPQLLERLCKDNKKSPPGNNFEEKDNYVQNDISFQQGPDLHGDYKQKLLMAIFMFDSSQGLQGDPEDEPVEDIDPFENWPQPIPLEPRLPKRPPDEASSSHGPSRKKKSRESHSDKTTRPPEDKKFS